MYTIQKAQIKDCAVISDLIHEIYPITYGSILSREQIDFMLKKSYSLEALKRTIAKGQDFFIVRENEISLGFIALAVEIDVLRIEKLYLLPASQGKGIGQQLLDFAELRAKEQKLLFLELNVNRGNKAYFFYLRQGFEVICEVDIPYYGYVLDDYVMRKRVKQMSININK